MSSWQRMNRNRFTGVIVVAMTMGIFGGIRFSFAAADSDGPIGPPVLAPGTGQASDATRSGVSPHPDLADSCDLAAIAPIMEDKLQTWVMLWRQVIPKFNVAEFRKFQETTIIPDMPAEYEPYPAYGGGELRKMIYVYSPDSTKFVDPYLETSLLEENGEICWGRDVDSGVALVDLRKNTWKQLLYCGTPCFFNDAAWISNRDFVVVGVSEYYPPNGEERCSVNTKCTWAATLCVFDLSRNSAVYFYGPETEKPVTQKLYLRARFPNMKFD